MKVPLFDLKVYDLDLKNELIYTFTKVLEKGRFFMGEKVEEFEESIARNIGAKYALGVGSGSSALYLALKGAGIKPGDEVITTPLTWIITINAIASCGAKPIFADIKDDFNIDPLSIEKKITKKTKAIVPMHYAGHMCDMNKIKKIANQNNLLIIEDAAQAFGAKLNNKMAGSFSIAAGFSMNPMKFFGGVGEAGAVVTSDYKIYKKLKKLRHAGTTSDPKKIITNNCEEISLNHKIDELNAALLLIILKKLPAKRKICEKIAKFYNKNINPKIKHQKIYPNEVHGRYVYPITHNKRNKIITYLNSKNIETKIMHEPLAYNAPVYKKFKINKLPVAEKMLKESLVIPSHEKLTDNQINYVVSNLNYFIEKNEI